VHLQTFVTLRMHSQTSSRRYLALPNFFLSFRSIVLYAFQIYSLNAEHDSFILPVVSLPTCGSSEKPLILWSLLQHFRNCSLFQHRSPLHLSVGHKKVSIAFIFHFLF